MREGGSEMGGGGLPRSGKTSSCLGRKAPPESTRYIHGSLFWEAISWALRCFLTVMG